MGVTVPRHLPGADEEATERVAGRLRREAEAERLVPFSMGWATRQLHEPLERTIVRADRRMITVKAESSNPIRQVRRTD
jgi:hypothetical protein